MDLITRFKNGWNAFMSRAPTPSYGNGIGYYSSRPDRVKLRYGSEKTIVNAVYNRIATDVSSLNFVHCELDDKKRYVEDIKSDLNECLTLSANVDQTSREFFRDVVISMLDEGCVAIVPVNTDRDPRYTDSYKIYSLRTAKITGWKPDSVQLYLYDERTGEKKDIELPKRMVAIIENPFYSVMNQHNSTMQRLIKKLALLDTTDEQTASGKLDLIIQLPYIIKTEARRQQAESRRKEIEMQLASSKYGIAYTDGTERITQLNRSLENNLFKQVEYFTTLFFSQLGMNQAILDGTATEQQILNYQSNVIEPIVTAIIDEMQRKFLTKTARTQGQAIYVFRDPFKLVPVNNIAEIADKFTRNEILTSNEIRQVIGMKPSSDPKADQLVNSNISQSKEQLEQYTNNTEEKEE